MITVQMTSTVASDDVLPFRGTRPYVHSTSVINAILPRIEGYTSLTVRFSRMTSHNRLRFVHVGREVETPGDAVFDAWWSAPPHGGKILVFETGEAMPALRVPYVEEEAIEGWSLDAGVALLGEGVGLGYTLIDRLVALNKAYLTTLFPLDANERYVATRFDLTRNLPAFAALSLRHVRRIGERHHATRILSDGVEAGLIYFASQPL